MLFSQGSKKRGISTLVATVLIILITVAAVAIIWVAVVPMINENIAFDGLDGRVSVLSSGGYTVYDADEEVAIVQVKRDVDEGVMNRVRILFLIEGNSYSSTVVAPGSGQTKTYTFDLSGYDEPESVSVAPIFVSSSGREKEGSVTSRADFVFGEIDSPINIITTYNLGEDYFNETGISGLVSWWEFDGNFNDIIGINDGTKYGDANVEGDVLNLDGTGDYVNLGSGDSLKFQEDFSISVWVYNQDEDTFTIVSRDNAGPNRDYDIEISSSNFFCMATFNESLVFQGSKCFGDVSDNEKWYYLVLTIFYDGTNTIINGYIDGEKTVEVGSFSGKLNLGTSPTYIGQRPYGACAANGSIDNLMIFNRVLSEEEIIAIYDVQKK